MGEITTRGHKEEIRLLPQQSEALNRIKVGSILMGGVGSGKTYTSIFWALGQLEDGQTLHVITTAMNRNKGDWQKSIELCGITNYIVDSWNNIKKYEGVRDSVFIFDEQRVVGYGKWSIAFINIARHRGNKWILCSATPGDEWKDYIPVFIANGFYKNKTQFVREHIVYDPHVPFPMIKSYLDTPTLEDHRQAIVVPMDVERHTKRHKHHMYSRYDVDEYRELQTTRFNKLEDRPIESPSEYTQLCRRITASSIDRQEKTLDLMKSIDKLIIFYNFNYELDILIDLAKQAGRTCLQYNGKKHELLDDNALEWVYLVQYNAGAEGWNCITTDSILFYSLNHSYKKMEQAEGRIDRVNTPFVDLHYYYMSSNAKIDKDIMSSISRKKRFNEGAWGKKYYER